MAHVGSEVERSIRAWESGRPERMGNALDRALELFDLTADPGELDNLADRPEHRDELQALRKQLWALIPPVERERILAVLAAGGEASEDSAGSRIDLEQLRSLGYIN